MLKVPFCKTSTFQASYFNRIVPLWNVISKIAAPENFSSLSRFKRFVLDTYFSLLTLSFVSMCELFYTHSNFIEFFFFSLSVIAQLTQRRLKALGI